MTQKIKKGTIIAGFPGVGKSYLEKHYKNAIELESSYFYWINPMIEELWGVEEAKGHPDRIKKEDWLQDYMNAIEQERHRCDYLCIVMFEEVLDELIKRQIPFVLVFPKLALKDEYMQRYLKRGNKADWIKSMEDIFETCILNILYGYGWYAKSYFLDSGTYLADILDEEEK